MVSQECAAFVVLGQTASMVLEHRGSNMVAVTTESPPIKQQDRRADLGVCCSGCVEKAVMYLTLPW